MFPHSGSLPIHPSTDHITITTSRINKNLQPSPPPAPPSPSPPPPSCHSQPTCSRPLFLVLEQVLLPPGCKHHEVPCPACPHVLLPHHLSVPARGVHQYAGLGLADQRFDDAPGIGWVEGLHKTHAEREYVEPLVSSYSGHPSPPNLFLGPDSGSTCLSRN